MIDPDVILMNEYQRRIDNSKREIEDLKATIIRLEKAMEKFVKKNNQEIAVDLKLVFNPVNLPTRMHTAYGDKCRSMNQNGYRAAVHGLTLDEFINLINSPNTKIIVSGMEGAEE